MGNLNVNNTTTEKIGFKVVEVVTGSPGHKCGLVELNDFILSVNGYSLSMMSKENIIELIKVSENKPLDIEVYDFNTKLTRYLVIVPSRNWPGDGLLGIVIRLEAYEESVQESSIYEEVDIGFDAIYTGDLNENDEEEELKSRVNNTKIKSRASKLLKRLSFSKNITSESAAIHSSDAPSLNVLDNNDIAGGVDTQEVVEQTDSGLGNNRRPSSTGRLFKSLSFNLSSKKNIIEESVGNDDMTKNVDICVTSMTDVVPKLERRSSKMFRKLSFTSSS